MVCNPFTFVDCPSYSLSQDSAFLVHVHHTRQVLGRGCLNVVVAVEWALCLDFRKVVIVAEWVLRLDSRKAAHVLTTTTG